MTVIDPTSTVRVLVASSSKHGSTTEIASRIAGVLESRGFETTVASIDAELDMSGFEVIILGSAVYAGHWRKEAKDAAEDISGRRPLPRVWLFSSGPLGDPPMPAEEPVDVESLILKTRAVEHRIFSGKLDRSSLNLGERAIVAAVKAQEGDFRDWEEIDSWAESIAAQVLRISQSAGV